MAICEVGPRFKIKVGSITVPFGEKLGRDLNPAGPPKILKFDFDPEIGFSAVKAVISNDDRIELWSCNESGEEIIRVVEGSAINKDRFLRRRFRFYPTF